MNSGTDDRQKPTDEEVPQKPYPDSDEELPEGENCPVIDSGEEDSGIVDEMRELSSAERIRVRKHRALIIERTAALGVVACVIFFLVKLGIGLKTQSSALITDAVSSLTDSYSSIIAIVGVAIAHRKPNEEHPNGFGRVEFLTAIIGAVIVIFTGARMMESAVETIRTPDAHPSALSSEQLLILGVTIAVKLVLYVEDRRIGHEYGSSGLVTASRSALLAAFLSLLVIASSLIWQYYQVDLDGWTSLVISILMIVTGILGFKKGVTALTGGPVDKTTADSIRTIILKYPPFISVYDIFINNTGAGRIRGTASVEVPVSADLEDVYESSRRARREILRKLNINLFLTPLAINYCDSAIRPDYHRLCNLLLKVPGVENVHGFKWNKARKRADLVVVTDFAHENDEELETLVEGIVSELLDDAHVCIDFHTSFVAKDAKPAPYPLPPSWLTCENCARNCSRCPDHPGMEMACSLKEEDEDEIISE